MTLLQDPISEGCWCQECSQEKKKLVSKMCLFKQFFNGKIRRIEKFQKIHYGKIAASSGICSPLVGISWRHCCDKEEKIETTAKGAGVPGLLLVVTTMKKPKNSTWICLMFHKCMFRCFTSCPAPMFAHHPAIESTVCFVPLILTFDFGNIWTTNLTCKPEKKAVMTFHKYVSYHIISYHSRPLFICA